MLKKAEYKEDGKQQIKEYGSYDPERDKKQCGKHKKGKGY